MANLGRQSSNTTVSWLLLSIFLVGKSWGFAPNKKIHRLSPLKAQYLATCLPGLSQVVKEEIESIPSAYNVETSGSAAVLFEGDSVQVGLQALLWTRATHRIMEFIASDDNIESRDDLYDMISSLVNVKQLLGDGKGSLLTLSVHVVLTNAKLIPADINHSHYTALTIKNALVDVVRDLRGDRPSVDVDQADVPLVAVVKGEQGQGATVSLYKCLHPPGSLHRRGYRGVMHKAAMKESMAAGLLLASGFHKKCANEESMTLVDPMAGSGSLVLEAAMMAADLAPGLMRIKCGMQGHSVPPVVRWKSDENVVQLWKDALTEATERAKQGLSRLRSEPTIKFIANDIHPGALNLLEDSLERAGFQGIVEVHEGDCQDFVPFKEACFVVTNPPWGVRLTEAMHESWESLRVFLRENCAPNTEAWVLSGNKAVTKHLGLRRSQSVVLQTGQQNLRWIQYRILDKAALQQGRRHANEKTYNGQHAEPPKHEYTKVKNQDTPRRYQPISARTQEKEEPMIPSRRPTKKSVSSHSYERSRRSPSTDKTNKSVTKPLSDAERAEKKKSWYI